MPSTMPDGQAKRASPIPFNNTRRSVQHAPPSKSYRVEVLKLFEKTPNALLLIMFCLYGVKKYVINGSIQKLLDIQKQRGDVTNEILKVMMRNMQAESPGSPGSFGLSVKNQSHVRFVAFDVFSALANKIVMYCRGLLKNWTRCNLHMLKS